MNLICLLFHKKIKVITIDENPIYGSLRDVPFSIRKKCFACEHKKHADVNGYIVRM